MIMRRATMHNSLTPAAFLVANMKLLPKGRVLDLAMGSGRNSVYLAREGFDVEGIDISPEAVSKAQELASGEKVNIKTSVADLETGFRIPADRYDVIICFYYLHRPLIPEIKHGLRPGGIVVCETYNSDQAEWGRPKNPEHLLKPGELLNMFCEYRILRYREGIIEPRKAIASIIARKPGGEH